jgi:hypothetical protein
VWAPRHHTALNLGDVARRLGRLLLRVGDHLAQVVGRALTHALLQLGRHVHAPKLGAQLTRARLRLCRPLSSARALGHQLLLLLALRLQLRFQIVDLLAQRVVFRILLAGHLR